MFYSLWYNLHADYAWLNIFRYITFRAFCAFLLSFSFVIILQPFFISYLKGLGVRGQPIRDDGPESHNVKSGTPTMGGLVIVAAIFISTMLFADLSNVYIWLVSFVMLSMSALGFVDDWRKVTKQDTGGIGGKTKLFWQTVIALIVAGVLVWNGFSTSLTFPFFKDLALPLGVFFFAFSVFVLVGTTNAVNLTDGLDGLAIVPIMTVGLTFGALAYLTGHTELADYLNIEYIAGTGELTIVIAAMIAGGLGFLWYNSYPAQVFMGDIGSMALGGCLLYTSPSPRDKRQSRMPSSA